MATTFKNQMRDVMNTAWMFIKKYGMTMSDALKLAWTNIKLRTLLHKKVVEFYFQKVDGSIRQAFGTLKEDMIPATQGTKKTADTCQVYFDTEKGEWRCFKRINLIKIA